MKDRSEAVEFSENGELLAVGCHDDCIYVFRTDEEEGFDLVGVLSGHESYINDLDFSLDSKFLRSAGVEGELRYWNLSTMKELVLNAKSCTPEEL